MKEQRKFYGLRTHIEDLLTQGWRIASREPLLLERGNDRLHFSHGMLVSTD